MKGILFGNKHTYDDWDLVLTDKLLGLPTPKTSSVDIEGADGSIDTSEVLSGEMFINDEETSYFDANNWEEYRRDYIGFIFQNYNLIDSYTVLENVEAAMVIQNIPKKERRQKALSPYLGFNYPNLRETFIQRIS